MNRILCLLVAMLLAVSGAANAAVGALDDVPAATLLLPYFEVDLGDANGVTTVVNVFNTRETPVIVHFVLWSDLGVATLGWNVYLTGYDLHRFDLRPMFTTGAMPATSHNNPAISPVGAFSIATNPATGVGPGTTACNGQLPLPNLPATLLNHIRNAHTGLPSPVVFGGQCSGFNHGDNIARGYLTMDVVRLCSLDFPTDAGYFVQGGSGVALTENAIAGDFAYIDRTRGRAEGRALIHLEASSTAPTTQPGKYTFYARYSGGADNREALPTTYWARFAAPEAATGKSSFLYWRDSKRPQNPFGCALLLPHPYPLSSNQIVMFDEQENPSVPETSPFSPPFPGTGLVPFAWSAGRVRMDSAELPVPPAAGWMYLNLNNAVAGSQVPHEPALQSWIGVSFEDAGGQFQYGFDAVSVDNAADTPDILLPYCDGPPDPPGCS